MILQDRALIFSSKTQQRHRVSAPHGAFPLLLNQLRAIVSPSSAFPSSAGSLGIE